MHINYEKGEPVNDVLQSNSLYYIKYILENFNIKKDIIREAIKKTNGNSYKSEDVLSYLKTKLYEA